MAAMATMVNMNNLLNGKDSRWLQLEVCREFQRNKCSRPDTECKFAHPPATVEVQNGRVTACYDSIKVSYLFIFYGYWRHEIAYKANNFKNLWSSDFPVEQETTPQGDISPPLFRSPTSIPRLAWSDVTPAVAVVRLLLYGNWHSANIMSRTMTRSLNFSIHTFICLLVIFIVDEIHVNDALSIQLNMYQQNALGFCNIPRI